jgi:hypothetical protein
MIEGRTVFLRAWKYAIACPGDFSVPVYFLDADLPENSEWDRTLTHYLYGGDLHYRLCQEIILGIGGVRMLRALGHQAIERYHMNEGHSSLLALELLGEEAARAGRQTPIAKTSRQCGKCVLLRIHRRRADQFRLVNRVLAGAKLTKCDVFCCGDLYDYLALNGRTSAA